MDPTPCTFVERKIIGEDLNHKADEKKDVNPWQIGGLKPTTKRKTKTIEIYVLKLIDCKYNISIVIIIISISVVDYIISFYLNSPNPIN